MRFLESFSLEIGFTRTGISRVQSMSSSYFLRYIYIQCVFSIIYFI